MFELTAIFSKIFEKWKQSIHCIVISLFSDVAKILDSLWVLREVSTQWIQSIHCITILPFFWYCKKIWFSLCISREDSTSPLQSFVDYRKAIIKSNYHFKTILLKNILLLYSKFHFWLYRNYKIVLFLKRFLDPHTPLAKDISCT